jgi:hypothetical protein
VVHESPYFSQLYAVRLNLSKPDDHVILPDIISKEPLAPVVRQRDDDWMMIVKWTLYAMINAEELGVTSQNIDEALKSKKPEVMAAGRHRGQLRRAAWAHQGLGRAYHPPCRQLRRDVRAQRRQRLQAADPAGVEPALERWRHPVRTADSIRLPYTVISAYAPTFSRILWRGRNEKAGRPHPLP